MFMKINLFLILIFFVFIAGKFSKKLPINQLNKTVLSGKIVTTTYGYDNMVVAFTRSLPINVRKIRSLNETNKESNEDEISSYENTTNNALNNYIQKIQATLKHYFVKINSTMETEISSLKNISHSEGIGDLIGERPSNNTNENDNEDDSEENEEDNESDEDNEENEGNDISDSLVSQMYDWGLNMFSSFLTENYKSNSTNRRFKRSIENNLSEIQVYFNKMNNNISNKSTVNIPIKSINLFENKYNIIEISTNKTNTTIIKPDLTSDILKNSIESSLSNDKLKSNDELLLRQLSFPCVCKGGNCGCCTGYLLDQFKQKGCINMTYIPDEFLLNMQLSFNDRVLYKNKFSGKNPPPACIRVPRIRQIKLCARFSNIYFTGRNIHLCISMEANWQETQLFDINFDCMRFGANGLATVAPEDGGGVPETIEEATENIEEYDDNA